jgi:hypothetical protein
MVKLNDSTLARIAGNIASGLVNHENRMSEDDVARIAVHLTRKIIAEIERTEPTGAK